MNYRCQRCGDVVELELKESGYTKDMMLMSFFVGCCLGTLMTTAIIIAK